MVGCKTAAMLKMSLDKIFSFYAWSAVPFCELGPDSIRRPSRCSMVSGEKMFYRFISIEVAMQGVNLLSTVVALGVLGLIALIALASIVRYSADEVFKVMGILSGLFGVITGSFTTYFFTREPMALAVQRAEDSESRAKTAELKLASLESKATGIVAAFSAFPDQTSVATIRKDKVFRNYLASAASQNSDFKFEVDPATGEIKWKVKSYRESDKGDLFDKSKMNIWNFGEDVNPKK